MHINFVGTRALLIDLEGLNQVMDWHAALSAKPLKNQVDCIAAATTLLLTFEAPDSARDAAEFRLAIDPHRRDLTTGEVAAVHAHFAAAGGLGLSEAHCHDAFRLLVPQHDVRHIAERLAFFAHILLEVQEQCGVLIELSERKHFFQDDRASRGTGSSRAALVRVRVPIVDFAHVSA